MNLAVPDRKLPSAVRRAILRADVVLTQSRRLAESYREIGDTLGLTTGNVGFLIHTGVKKLRKLMTTSLPAAHAGQQS